MAARPVVVTGATGQIGYSVLQALDARGRPGIAVSRAPVPAWAATLPGIRWWRRDLTQPGDRPPVGAVAGLVHAGPLGLAPAALELVPGLRRAVAFSSTSIETKADSPDPGERALVARLKAAERAFAQASGGLGVAWTLLRPTLVYGCGLDRNLSRIAAFLEHFPVFPVSGGGRGLRQPVHARDLAETALNALERPVAAGRIYAVAGGTTLSYRAMVAAVARSLGRRPVFLPLPAALLGALGRLGGTGLTGAMARRMGRDLVFDDTPARADLGHAPRPFAPDASAWRSPAQA